MTERGLAPIPKVLSSDASIVRRFYSPKTYISKVLYSEGSIGSIVRKFFVPKIQ